MTPRVLSLLFAVLLLTQGCAGSMHQGARSLGATGGALSQELSPLQQLQRQAERHLEIATELEEGGHASVAELAQSFSQAADALLELESHRGGLREEPQHRSQLIKALKIAGRYEELIPRYVQQLEDPQLSPAERAQLTLSLSRAWRFLLQQRYGSASGLAPTDARSLASGVIPLRPDQQAFLSSTQDALDAELRGDPSLAELSYECGRLLQQHGHHEEARSWLRELLLRFPDSVEAAYAEGLLGELDSAPGAERSQESTRLLSRLALPPR